MQKIPLNIIARKDKYRELLVLLLSNSSSYINGSIISADGEISAL